MSSPIRVLVIGATGNIGRNLLPLLLSRGVRVRAASRNPEKAGFPAGVEAVRFDWSDPVQVQAALTGVDRAFFLMPSSFEGDAAPQREALGIARAVGVRHVVLLSAKGIEANPGAPLRRLELALQSSGLAWTLLRPTFFAQNMATFQADFLRREGQIVLPAGDGATAFVDTRDIAEVAARALTEEGHEGRTWTLTGPRALTYHEVAELIGRATGRPIRYHSIPAEAYREGLRSAGMPPAVVEGFVWLYDGVVAKGYAAEVTDDVPSLLGRPARSFEDFVTEHAQVWREVPATA